MHVYGCSAGQVPPHPLLLCAGDWARRTADCGGIDGASPIAAPVVGLARPWCEKSTLCLEVRAASGQSSEYTAGIHSASATMLRCSQPRRFGLTNTKNAWNHIAVVDPQLTFVAKRFVTSLSFPNLLMMACCAPVASDIEHRQVLLCCVSSVVAGALAMSAEASTSFCVSLIIADRDHGPKPRAAGSGTEVHSEQASPAALEGGGVNCAERKLTKKLRPLAHRR